MVCKNLKNLSVVSLLLLLIFVSAKAQTFQAEEDIKNRALLPQKILLVLKQTESVKRCVKDEATKKFSSSWFQIAKVNLNDDKLSDYVVKAKEGCLLEANIIPFWVFKKTTKGFELVLEVHSLAIDIGNKRKTKGFYDIGTFRATAVQGVDTLWVFDGRKYKLKRTKVSDL